MGIDMTDEELIAALRAHPLWPTGAAESITEVAADRLSALRGVTVRETMWGEVVLDRLGEPVFRLCEEDNRDGHHEMNAIELAASAFPVGTKISISEPVAALSRPEGEGRTFENMTAEECGAADDKDVLDHGDDCECNRCAEVTTPCPSEGLEVVAIWYGDKASGKTAIITDDPGLQAVAGQYYDDIPLVTLAAAATLLGEKEAEIEQERQKYAKALGAVNEYMIKFGQEGLRAEAAEARVKVLEAALQGCVDAASTGRYRDKAELSIEAHPAFEDAIAVLSDGGA